MRQTNRGTYNTDENAAKAFYRSGFGKAVIAIAVIILLCIIALLTVPSDSQMLAETHDNNFQCVIDNDSIQGDDLDDTAANIFRIVTSADTTLIDKETLAAYHKFNNLEVYRHALFATTYVRNNLYPEGKRVAFGLFGVVIPTIHYQDLLLRTGRLHRDYGDGTIRSTINYGSDYMGENPNLGPYREKQ